MTETKMLAFTEVIMFETGDISAVYNVFIMICVY